MLSENANQQNHDSLAEGASAAWPICIGYIPIGLAFGILARKAGLTPLQISMMSVFVFAGSSQFIAVSMLADGASAIAIILTTFMVNLRHLLMSSALAVFFKGKDRKKLSLFAYGVTDESFAVNLARLRQGNWGLNRSIVVNQLANFTWFVSTVIGGYGGQFVPEKAFGMDYALIAMFICLLVFQLKGRKYIITALIAGISATVFSLLIPGNFYIILASVMAATLGMIFKKYLT